MPGLLGLSPSLPEPKPDARAQLAALADVTAGKNTAFFPPGSRLPRRKTPVGVQSVRRPEGRLMTTDPAKATAFARTPALDDSVIARLLGYTQSKRQAAASGMPAMVQALAHGGVAHAQLASRGGLPAALAAAKRAVPNARLRVVPPAAAVGRQVGLLGM